MVNHRISADIKECGLSLWERGWEPEQICNTMCFSQPRVFIDGGRFARNMELSIGLLCHFVDNLN